MKATIVMMVALTTDVRISFEASNTTFRTGRRSSGGLAWFSRSLLNTFSTSMMASSTSEPMAMAIPPRLIVLIVSPNASSTKTATRSDNGSAISEMTVVRKFIRKMNRMMMTNIAPSISDFWMLSIELSMNRDWRKMSVETWMSDGRLSRISSSVLSRFSVSSSEFVLGCLVTVISTAAFPRSEAIPKRGNLAPTRTSATSSSMTGMPSGDVRMTALPICFGSVVERMPRTMYSLPYWFRIPPFALRLISSTTVMISSNETL